MDKLSESWTPTAVSSTFRLATGPLTDKPGHRPTAGGERVYSAVCGLGWRFGVHTEEQAKSTVVDGAGATVPSYAVHFVLNPHISRGAAYGRLILRTTVQHLIPSAQSPPPEEVPCDFPRDSSLVGLGTFIYPSNAPTAIITFSVTLPASLGMPLPRTLTPKMENTLEDTLNGKELIDVKFYAFSGWCGTNIAHPKALFAQTALLRGFADDFDSLLDGHGFSEAAKEVDLDAHEAEDEEIGAADYGYDSDSDLESEEDETIQASSQENKVPNGQAMTKPELEGEQQKDPARPGRRVGRVIVLKGTAFKTWKALLYFLYTGRIRFNQLTSHSDASDSSIAASGPSCSPKSMYRLADKFGFADLQALALESISTQLSKVNIIHEVFSSFTSMYPAIQDLEVDFLVKNFPVDASESLAAMTQQICDGVKPHCAGTLRMVLERMAVVGQTK
ncbi:hypothetical protein HMN09_00479700 [Mycena chlorophos]|uniref:BTB domain-containing protein n=1 Tax=Mycena chlorophos TaxID=658473 RepID=A0A8H6TH51_MYCCL|nr:hypothetical protein HMN09_00479700 [Mycena chlorophos]